MDLPSFAGTFMDNFGVEQSKWVSMGVLDCVCGYI